MVFIFLSLCDYKALSRSGHSVAEDVDASVQDEADVLDALDMQKKSSFMAHSTPHARRAHSASRSPAWYDYNVNHQVRCTCSLKTHQTYTPFCSV